MKIKEASVSSVFAWGSTPNHASSLVTGSVAGAMGDDFCADGHIELFSCDIHNSDAFLVRIGSAITYDRFTDIDWATFGPNEGLVAGALVDGTVLISDPTNIRDGIDRPISIIEAHSSKCRVVQFNPIQEHLLATAGEDREFRIWNLNNASEPLLTLDPTNPKNPHSSDIADLKWNPKHPHIIACATSAGSNHVWDLRAKRCTMNFQDGTKSVSSLAWHPEVPTQLVTATDDVRGTLHVWDLKKAVAPVRVMSNHSDGVLSLSWCTHDANLLLSCGRDGRTLCWNPNTGILNSELPRQENWVFRVRWSKMIPNLFATSCFDNTLNVYSLQGCISKNLTEDIFSSKQTSVDSAPKWLKRPAGAIFLQSGKILRYSKSRGAEISLANTELNAQFRELEKALQLFRLNRDECTLQAVLDKLEKQNLSSDRENLMIGIIFSMHLPSNLFDPKSTLNINIEQIKHHVTEVIQSDAECDLSQIHGLIHKCLISDLIEEASYLCLKIGNTEDALLIASYRDEAANELQKKVMHIILDRRKHLHYMNFIRSLMLADMHSMIESSIGFATWNELLYFTFLHKKKFDQKKFCEQLATFFSSKNELATEACLLYAQNVDKIISIWSDLVTERIRTMDDVVRRELMIQIYVHKIMSLEDLTQTICSHDVFSSSLIDHVRTLMIHGFKKEAMYIIQRYPHIKQFSKIANTHCSEIENSVNKSVCTSTGSQARNHPKTTNSSHKSTQNIDSTQKFSAPVPSTDGAMNTMKRAGASKVSDLPKSTSNEWTSVQKDLMTRLQDAANKISDKRKRESIEKALTVLSSNFDSQTLPGELIDILSRYSTCLGSPEARDIIKFLGSNYWDLFKPFMNIKFL